MIPKLLHHIWLGPRPVPQQWADGWRAMHPDWTQRIWREADLAALTMRNRAQFERQVAEQCWPGAADVARLEILYQQGGVYVDIDSKPLMSLSGAAFMQSDAFAGYEPVASLPGRVANGTIGATPGSEVILTAIKLVGDMTVTEPAWDTIGAPALTAAFLVHHRCCDARVLPASTFFRIDVKGRKVVGPPSYVEHFWATTTARYPRRTVVLVPRRAGVPERDEIWRWCKRIWEQQGWPIYEGHDEGTGLFNASRARNRAAALASVSEPWDVAIFADADTVPWDWRQVRSAAQIAYTTDHFVRPARSYYLLDAAQSQRFMETGRRPTGGRRLGEHVYGGIHAVSRKLWELSGGYDERFLGWGGEDAAFQYACQTLSGYRKLDGEVFHLYHPMQQRDPSTEQFKANVALEKRYVDASRNPAAMRALIAERQSIEVAA